MGISNQRETTVIWHRETGVPIYNAIVWLDRRTEDDCNLLESRGFSKLIQDKTGLILDPYFSASKISWILSNVEGARSAAIKGELAFGTIDSWLLWNLTNGAVHATDITNASRTMLFNINCQDWDSELLDLFEIPKSLLPEVRDCNAYFGSTHSSILGASIDIYGIAGDQQAAALGQACFTKGMIKSTFGTGCFALLNTGAERAYSHNKLITTIAYRIGGNINYAIEGSIFTAGAVINWLRDGLNFTESPAEYDKLAKLSNLDDAVYLIPAFSGLGAPWWDTEARGAILGMTLSTGKKELARAALESVCYQTFDLLQAMKRDIHDFPINSIRVDGGMSKSNWSMQFLADILQIPIDRSIVTETSALGAAWLAASKIGFWPNCIHFADNWKCQQRFTPQMDSQKRQNKLSGWHVALERIKS
jgi:glycerol kinase